MTTGRINQVAIFSTQPSHRHECLWGGCAPSCMWRTNRPEGLSDCHKHEMYNRINLDKVTPLPGTSARDRSTPSGPVCSFPGYHKALKLPAHTSVETCTGVSPWIAFGVWYYTTGSLPCKGKPHGPSFRHVQHSLDYTFTLTACKYNSNHCRQRDAIKHHHPLCICLTDPQHHRKITQQN